MSRDEALQLARELALRHETVRAYAERRGLPASSVSSRAYRAGIRLGVEIRRCRVAEVLRRKAASPEVPISRLAIEAGYCVPSHFNRARRRLARWDAV